MLFASLTGCVGSLEFFGGPYLPLVTGLSASSWENGQSVPFLQTNPNTRSLQYGRVGRGAAAAAEEGEGDVGVESDGELQGALFFLEEKVLRRKEVDEER